MTSPPSDGEPPPDMQDSAPDPTSSPEEGPDSDGHSSGESSDTDAMGIDDDDPIDAALVGEPVDGSQSESESESQ